MPSIVILELAGSQTLTVQECDKDGHSSQDEDGNFIQDKMIDVDDFKKYKIKTECVGDSSIVSKQLQGQIFYVWTILQQRRMVHRRNYYPDHKGLDLKKLKINYENADGLECFMIFSMMGMIITCKRTAQARVQAPCNGRRKFTMIEFLVFATVFTLIVLLTGGSGNSAPVIQKIHNR